jgi:hypothetical protein
MLLGLVPFGVALSQWAPAGLAQRGAAPLVAIAARLAAREGTGQDMPATTWPSSGALGTTVPSVLLSIETAGTSADPECDMPVVLPGYLLPDDNHEEAAHEGS